MPRIVAVLVCTSLLCGSSARAGSFQDALRAMARGDYLTAASRLAGIPSTRPDSARAGLARGRALFLAGRYQQARKAYRQVQKRVRPDTPYATKARFGMAESLAAMKKFEPAERLFAEALSGLTSDARRRSIAARFVQLGDENLEPPEGRTPNPARAEQFLRAAIEVGADGEMEEQIEIKIGRSLSAQKRQLDAARYLDAFCTKHEKSPRLPEARFLAGKAYLEAGQPTLARRAFMDLLALNPKSARAPQAAFLLSRTYGMPNPKDSRSLVWGLYALEQYIHDWPKAEHHQQARLEAALAPLSAGRQAEAEQALKSYIAAGGPQDDLASARYHLGRALAEQQRYREASAAYRDYLQKHPAHGFWLQARRGIEDMAFNLADHAFKNKKWKQAVEGFESFAAAYPAAGRTPRALLQAAKAKAELKDVAGALALLSTLTTKFPADRSAAAGWYQTGLLLEEKRGDIAKARAAYKKATQSPGGSSQASVRLTALDQPGLVVESPPVFHTGDKPVLVWHARNIESVKVNIYRIEAEDFFKDRMQMESVVDMDIALCAPDVTFDVPVKGYRKHLRITQRVPLKIGSAGLYLVHLTGGSLEATTAVVISDLGIIVKSGPGKIFVFSEDMKRTRPMGKTRIIVADGSRILAEGKTAGDGVWQHNLPHSESTADLRVLAIRDGQLAWTGIDYRGGQPQTAASPRAFVFTDRPAYQPGDSVTLAGIVRDRPDLPGRGYLPGGKVRIDIQLSQGSLSRTAKLDEFGVFHAKIALDPAIPPGRYSFSVRAHAGAPFGGSFTVQRYRLPAYDLEATFDRPVVFRGEPLSGVIRLRHRSGAPAAFEKISYRLDNAQKWIEATSDKLGQVRFSFPTRAMELSHKAVLQMRLARLNLIAEARALVAVEGYSVSLSAGQKTIFAGQPFDLQVAVSAPDGKPRAASLTVRSVKRLPGSNTELRDFVRQIEVPPSGKLSLPLSLPGKGVHIVRVFGTDRAGHPITNELGVSVVGPDEPGIFLDLERTKLTLGTPARAIIRSHLDRALLLLTCETDDILEYRTLELKRGQNKIDIPLSAKLVPNFVLAAAAMHKDHFYSASRALRVTRKLLLSVRPDRKNYGPGDEVNLTLIARDADGHPVDARLVVAVVDQALYKLFPENLPDLVATFQQLRPEGEIETISSNVYRFPGVEGSEVEKAEIEEAEGSAAMAALGARRRKMTARAAADFSKMAKTEGLVGSGAGYGVGIGGMGAGGYGRGAADRAYLRMGKAQRSGMGALRKYFSQTAAFFPDLRTGPDGIANATFKLPDTLTTWCITARGVTRDTQLGEKRTRITASRKFWVELVAPPALEEKDQLQPAARAYNDSRAKLSATVELKAAGKRFTKTVEIGPLASAELLFEPLSVPAGSLGKMRFELSAKADAFSDHLVRELPVVPRGVREQTLVSGLIEKSAARTMKLDPDLGAVRLKLQLDAGLSRIIMAGRLDPLLFGDRPEQALVALNILDQIGPHSNAAMRDMVLARLRRALQHLVVIQKGDGGWALNRTRGASDPVMTARATRALARARKLEGVLGWNFPQAGYQKALTALKGYLVSLPPDDFVRRAEVLYALAHEGRSQIPQVHLQRMHRLRASMPVGAQALLGLTWMLIERPEKAAELSNLVRAAYNRALPVGCAFSWLPIWSEPLVDRALSLELLAQTTPTDALVAKGTNWLLEIGSAFGWQFPEQAEAVTAALGKLLAAPGSGQRFRVSVSVNGKKSASVALPAADGGYAKMLEIDPGLLHPGDNKLELRLEGSGRCFFLARLSGYRQQARPPAEKAPVTLERHIEPLPKSFHGREIPSGFSVVAGSSPRWIDETGRIPAGRRVRVTLKIKRDFAPRIDHCVLSERIPPGFELVERSLGGNSAHMMRSGRRMAFYLPSPGYIQTVGYVLRAINPGSYHFAPARLVSVINPGTSVLSAGRPFTIDPPGALESKRRVTPDELYHLGLAAADEKLPALALEKLEQLNDNFDLREDIARDVQARLLFASIELDDAQRIVKYFELAKEKNPGLVIPFDKIAPLQTAYRKVGSFEAGLHLDRGVCDARFMSEVHGVGILETQDEMAEAIDLLRYQLDSYPDGEPAARATYAFSQVMFDRADRLRGGEPLPGFDRPGLIDQVIDLMSRFLGLFPTDSQAPAAIYSLAAAMLERDQAGRAIDWCRAGLHRFAKSDLAPAITYLEAFAHFKLGQYGPSLELCRNVIDESPDEENQDMARYIMAQIYHARGQMERALPLYRKVQDSFRDARETIRESERTRLTVPEVITVAPGERPTLTMKVRNIERIDLRAYRVDPMNLYLVKGSLSDLSAVNLAGIKPVLATTLTLRKRVGITRTEKKPLRLPGKGAYLLLLYAGPHAAHSLVLVGGLSLDVTEIAAEGRVRVTVRTARGKPIPDARVQLKGTDDERFIVGRTDLRGIFIASDVNGAVTVIARHKGAFGLYRGTRQLSGQPPPPGKDVRNKKKTVYDFEDDTINGELVKPEAQYLMNRKAASKAKAKDFFQQKVDGMSAQQAR